MNGWVIRPKLAASVVLCFCLLLQGCVVLQEEQSAPDRSWVNAIEGEIQPWTHEAFDSTEDKFTFALFSDLTGGEREGVFEIAIAQLNLLRPELIINVGDLIEGETDDRSELDRQWNSFDERAQKARAPVFYVGGNHDLTGETMQAVWDERYGRRYYHFVYRDTLFLVLDTEDHTPERTREIARLREEAMARVRVEGWGALTESAYRAIPEYSAGNIGAEQSAYFRQVVADNPEVKWTFLFMHKAPWLRPDHDPFFALEDVLATRPYTVFHGHEHAYQHLERNGRDYIQLATTGGVQLPGKGRSVDHVTLVTVDGNGVDIANLLMSGILDRTGHVPLKGERLCFEAVTCAKE